MLEFDITNRLYSYAFYLSAAIMLAASLIFQNVYLFLIALILLPLSAVYFRSGHILNNFLLKHGKVIEVYNDYRLSENLTAAVKRIGDAYFAVGCVLMNDVHGERNGERLASLVQNTGFPFEFSLGLKAVDHDKIVDALEEKRRMKEIEMVRSDPKKYDKINTLRRELSVIDSEIRGVKGQKILALVVRLKAFAKSANEFEASREAAKNTEQLANVFSSSLGFEYEILKGERLIEELSLEREAG